MIYDILYVVEMSFMLLCYVLFLMTFVFSLWYRSVNLTKEFTVTRTVHSDYVKSTLLQDCIESNAIMTPWLTIGSRGCNDDLPHMPYIRHRSDI